MDVVIDRNSEHKSFVSQNEHTSEIGQLEIHLSNFLNNSVKLARRSIQKSQQQ